MTKSADMAANYAMISKHWFFGDYPHEYMIYVQLNWFYIGWGISRRNFYIDPSVMQKRIRDVFVYSSFQIGLRKQIDAFAISFIFQILPPGSYTEGELISSRGLYFVKHLVSVGVLESRRRITIRELFQNIYMSALEFITK